MFDTYKFIVNGKTTIIYNMDKAATFKCECENRGLNLRASYKDEYGYFVFVYEK